MYYDSIKRKLTSLKMYRWQIGGVVPGTNDDEAFEINQLKNIK